MKWIWLKVVKRQGILTRAKLWLTFAFLSIVSISMVSSQNPLSNLKCVTLNPTGDTQLLDSLLIDAQSIAVSPQIEFKFDPSNSTINFKPNTQEETSSMIKVCFRTLPFNLQKSIFRQSLDLYDSTALFKQKSQENPMLAFKKEEIFSTPNIQKSGSLTRGISFGNAQSLNVNSIFNFQMEGKLSEKLNIRADITDQNIPFQPAGNTLQLREFDNVILEVYNEKFSLMTGDLLLRDASSNFLRYNKNVQGGQFRIDYQLGESMTASSRLAVSSAKGQFADITVQSQEGVQGPYQLFGPNGQKFVIVLANSEQVYVDGRLLVRGFSNDYIVDYNLGEITFNPNVPITEFTRIRVTFEYSDQNYSRSIINAAQQLNFKKTSIEFSYYKEQDNKNKPLSFQLTNDDKLQMSLAGDDNLPVPISGASPSDFVSTAVLYEQRDTVDLDGNTQVIYVASQDSIENLFRVIFSDVGIGNGDYQQLATDVNGRVFQWVSAVAGIAQANFAPVRFVPAPGRKEMLAISAKTELTDHLTAFTDLAISNQDQNLFSAIGNQDNKGWALKTGLIYSRVPIRAIRDYFFTAQMDYEYNSADFKAIDRFRPIEYDRNWSYNAKADTSGTGNHIFNTRFAVAKDKDNCLEAKLATRQKANAIDGFKTGASLKKKFGSVNFRSAYFYMKNENLIEKSNWKKWHVETYYDQMAIVPGYKVEEDRNEVAAPNADSLTRTAMNFTAHRFYVRNRDDLKTKFRIEYILRENRAIAGGELVSYSKTKTTNLNIQTPSGRANQLALTFTHRDIQYTEAFTEMENGNFILGRLHWQSDMAKRHIRMNMTYNTSSSREILRGFIFVEVTPGEGTHTWRDLNGNGLQEVTEFFEAINFDERNYIKVFVPTSDMIDAFSTIFTANMTMQLPRIWSRETGVKRLLSKFQNQFNVNINKKSTNDDFSSRFNPFDLDISNDDLIFTRDLIRNTLFYNRSSRGFGGDVFYLLSHDKQLNQKGVDSRSNREFGAHLRYNVNREITLQWAWRNGLKRNISQFQQDRSYLIATNSFSPGMIWQPENNLRVSLIYNYKIKINQETELDEEFSKINTVILEGRWSGGVKNSLNASVSYTSILYEGDLNTAVSYELLEALQPGTNFTWRLNYVQKLASGLQLSVGYEGRKSGNQRLIQLGRMQVTALF